jgi:DNA helicase-2/ATP-dependent DNA helicase PcrA
MENNLMENLNKEQLQAVQHESGPLLIVAGAGTGKTTAITQRIAYLIEQDKAKSDEILALTFTEKAASEMEERVDRLLPMGYVDLWISTFHSFGERILNQHGLEIGLSGDAKLLNEFEGWALIKKNFDKFDLDYYRPMGNPTKFIHALLKHFSRLKDEDISPGQYLEYAEELKQNLDQMLSGKLSKAKQERFASIMDVAGVSGLPQGHFLRGASRRSAPQDDSGAREIATQEVERINEVANAYHVYQQLLLDNNALDFGDLINYCLKLFRERPKILSQYRKQFKYILLDEFQDTNWAQYELIKLLAASKNNLVVVGDDDQSIYKFRGASVSNILAFKKDFKNTKEIVLTKNYRNAQNILDLAYDFIQLNNPNRLEVKLKSKSSNVKAGISKKLVAQNKSKGTIEVIEGTDLSDEIRTIVETIADLKIKDKDAMWNDFGILTRSNEGAKEISSYLEASGMPYQYLASRGLYTRAVVMDVMAYLKLLDDYHESPAVYRVLNIPVFNFNYQELINFNYWAKKKSWSLFEVLKSARSFNVGEELVPKIERLLKLIEGHSTLTRDKQVSEVIIAFLNDSGYLKYLTEQEDKLAQEGLGYLNKFMKRVKGFEGASDEPSVKAFLEELTLEIDSGEEGAISLDPDSGPDSIKVMTVHGAKGLEFKYVFIANLVDKRFPSVRRAEPILIPDALVKETLPEGDIHIEEERRLFYVALTRAKERLYLSWAPDYGGVRRKKPSQFLAECKLVKERKPEEKPPAAVKKGIEFEDKKIMGVAEGQANFNPPSYYSYTQLTAFAKCPYQYRFAHVLKVPRRSRYTLSFGQTMHLTLQRLFQLVMEKRGLGQASLFGATEGKKDKAGKVKIDLKEILSIYKEKWIDNWYESKEQKQEYQELGQASLKDFFEKHKDNWPHTVSLEQGINLKLEGRRIFGKIDRVDDLGKAGLGIVDYKTGQPKNKDKISLEDKEQLLIYQMAAEQVLGREIANLQFYYLNNNSEVDFLGDKKEKSQMEEKILTRIGQIEEAFSSGVFPPKPSLLCKYCDFFNICEYRKN